MEAVNFHFMWQFSSCLDVCAGSLITFRCVLSAANCVSDGAGKIQQINEFGLLFGANDMNHFSGNEALRKVVDIIQNRQYENDRKQDIAILVD